MGDKLPAVTITTYAEFATWRNDFIKPNGLSFLIIIGGAGLSKSFSFRKALKGDECLWVETTASAAGLYCRLYQHVDRPVVIDDVDGLFGDKQAVSLMKSLCQTDEVKHLGWGKLNAYMREEAIPNTFATKSRVAILANKMESIEENLAAVLDRAFVVNFAPSVQEVHREVGTWFKDKEIYNFIGENLKSITTPSMRYYKKSQQLKGVGSDWKSWLLEVWGEDPKMTLIAKVLNDPSLKNSKAREAKFAELGGGTRNTYMIYQRKYKAAHGKAGK